MALPNIFECFLAVRMALPNTFLKGGRGGNSRLAFHFYHNGEIGGIVLLEIFGWNVAWNN